MPRTARKPSATGVYHAMQRGINKEVIFKTSSDYNKYLHVLSDVKDKTGFRLYAYCIMNNHVHFLIKTGDETLGEIFKRIGCRFVPWYNRKYDRVGHLFQNRYKSEPVETDSYFKAVIRYIIQNPLKAGLENAPGKYQWSSYNDFLKQTPGLTDTDFPVSLFGSRQNLLEFVARPDNDSISGLEAPKNHIIDHHAQQLFSKITSCDSAAEFRRFSKPIQKDYLNQLHKENLTISQITRLTGLSTSTVSRTVHAASAGMI